MLKPRNPGDSAEARVCFTFIILVSLYNDIIQHALNTPQDDIGNPMPLNINPPNPVVIHTHIMW